MISAREIYQAAGAILVAATLLLVPVPAMAQIIATPENTQQVIELRILQIEEDIANATEQSVIDAGNERIAYLEGLITVLGFLPQANLQSQFDYFYALVSPSFQPT